MTLLGVAELTSNGTQSVFYCPSRPMLTWVLSDTTTFYIASITTSIVSPLTIFLNIVVVIAIWKIRELQTNSNILLASMAGADFLVGAVSMPLCISLDVLLLRKEVSQAICKITFANELVLYGAVFSTLYHLTVIAWERYLAVAKWNQYHVFIRRARIKKLIAIAWILAVLTTAPVRILKAAGVHNILVEVFYGVCCLPALVCMSLIGYFYIRVYQEVRKLERREDSIRRARVRMRHEDGIAKRTLAITVVSFVYFIPSVIVLLFGKVVPFLRTSSYFRWSELVIQLNSLINPILYCFVLNKNFRNVVLRMMKIKKTVAVDVTTERLSSRPAGRLSLQLLSVQNFNEEQRRIGLISKAEWQDFSAVVSANVVNQTAESRFIYNNQPVAENNPVASPSEVIVEVHKPSATLSGVPREETVQGKSAGSFPEQRLVIKPRTQPPNRQERKHRRIKPGGLQTFPTDGDSNISTGKQVQCAPSTPC